jgi:5'-3' exonuclease
MLSVFENMNAPTTFLFIDGSYYCFHRYYSLIRWWKSAYPETPLDDPFLNEKFVDKFKKTFVSTITEIPKNLKIKKDDPKIIIGKDCKRENIWRNEIFKDYKANRVNGPEDGFMGGPFFKMAYEDKLFEQAGARAILSHPKLEADDCIAISVKHLLEKYENVKIYIITSDKDYLQLVCPRVNIFNLSYKNIANEKSSFGGPEADLFCKIVMGDPSDNIPSVLSKCGPKTALKCYNDRDYFNERMKKENAYEKFNNNQKIIDFNSIPEELISEFMNNKCLLN